ncbi:hypothetical protein [Streptomyces sp. NPDC055287]
MGIQRLRTDGKPEADSKESRNPRLDLSVAQVAGSAVAAVVAAVLASKLGVYGTIIGAGVVSVVATSGGTIFQHLFRRTGEQLREVTVHAKPKATARQVTEARVRRVVTVPADLANGELSEEFGEATTHGTRVRGRKRSAVAALVVFVVAMGGITAYELLSGGDLSGGRGSTVGNVLRGGEQHHRKTPPAGAPSPADTPGGGSATPGTGEDGGRSPGQDSGSGTGDTSTSPDPARTPPPASDGGPAGDATPTPTPTPSESAGPGTDSDAGEDAATGDASDGDDGAKDSGAQTATPAE